MNRKIYTWAAMFVAAVLLCGTRVGLAANVTYGLNIYVTQTGTSAYQFTVNGVPVVNSATAGTWTSLGSTQAGWDSMVTKPGVASGTSVGTTNNFALSGMVYSNGSTRYSLTTVSGSYWLSNAAGTTEAALIVPSGVGNTVSNLLILDGSPNGIFVYKAPTTLNPTNLTPSIATYGYTGSGISSYNPGAGPAINQISGLESDLEWNGGFKGNGNLDNINRTPLTELFQDPLNSQTYETDVFTSPNQVDVETYTGGIYTYQDVTPTIYFQDPDPAPLPATCWGVLSLLGLLPFAMKKLWSSRQIQM